jgi:multisubunit Na+/H+ antiporter MnhE subunit
MSRKPTNAYLKAGIITGLVLVITLLHFTTSTDRMYLHKIYQRSYYIPIVLACFWFEIWGGVTTAFVLSAYISFTSARLVASSRLFLQQYAEIAMYSPSPCWAGIFPDTTQDARTAGKNRIAAEHGLSKTE